MIHLMEGSKLLDANIFEIVKPIVTNIVAPWIFEIFISFYSFKHTWS